MQAAHTTGNTINEFESHLNNGMVLGKNGNWCSIDEAINEEKELNIHLENGEILHNGKWIPIVKALQFATIDTQSEPDKKTDNSERTDKHSQFQVNSIKKLNKRKKKKGTKSTVQNSNKAKKNSIPFKENKILLADVNIKADKIKTSDFKLKPEAELAESEITVSKATTQGPAIKRETSIEKIQPKPTHQIKGNELGMTEVIDRKNIEKDKTMTQIIEKFPSKPNKTADNLSKQNKLSSEKTLIKKLGKETLTIEETVTQVIPLPIHIFRGKQINKTKRNNLPAQLDKKKSLPEESLEEWAQIKSNFLKNTLLFSVSAILVIICFYLLYYFIIL